MKPERAFIKIAALCISSIILTVFGSCKSNTGTFEKNTIPTVEDQSNPVQQFYLFVNTGGLPPAGYIPPMPFATQPFPTDIQIVEPGQKIYVFVLLKDILSGTISFPSQSSLTSYNRVTNQETVLGSPYPTSIVAPNKPGDYEIRLYFDNKLAASERLIVET
jgi:hypothetical protein